MVQCLSLSLRLESDASQKNAAARTPWTAKISDLKTVAIKFQYSSQLVKIKSIKLCKTHMRTLKQEISYRIEKHALSEVLDSLADAVKEFEEFPERDELVKSLELGVAIALRFECSLIRNISTQKS